MSPFRFVLPLAAVSAVFSTGCYGLMGFHASTPMNPAAIDALTTCKDVDLGKIKKNLILNGYSIRSASDDTIETDFKQVDGYGTEKTSERISLVKMDDHTVKFHVRVRSEGMQKVETGRMQTTSGTVATDSRLVQTQNEEDAPYYDETRAQHEATRRQVCGS